MPPPPLPLPMIIFDKPQNKDCIRDYDSRQSFDQINKKYVCIKSLDDSEIVGKNEDNISDICGSYGTPTFNIQTSKCANASTSPCPLDYKIKYTMKSVKDNNYTTNVDAVCVPTNREKLRRATQRVTDNLKQGVTKLSDNLKQGVKKLSDKFDYRSSFKSRKCLYGKKKSGGCKKKSYKKPSRKSSKKMVRKSAKKSGKKMSRKSSKKSSKKMGRKSSKKSGKKMSRKSARKY